MLTRLVRLPLSRAAFARAMSTPAFFDKIKDQGTGELRLDLSDPWVARITVSNPKARNALSGKMMTQLNDAIETLESGSYNGIGLVVRGLGCNFCSGADLHLVKHVLNTPEDGLAMCTFMQDLMTRLKALPYVSLGVIEGYALGGGSELATATDFRVIAPDAIIQFKHALMALTPGWGGGTRLTHLVGRRAAIKLMASAEQVKSAEALRIGLVDGIMEGSSDVEVEDAIRKFFKPFITVAENGKGSAAAIRKAKTIVDFADRDASVAGGMAHEREIFTTLWASPDNKQQVENTINRLKH